MTFAGILQAVAAVTLVLSVVTISGMQHWLIELFAHFRLQYLVLSVLLLAVFVFLRSPGWSGAMVVAVAVNAWFVVPWYIGERPTSDGPTVKVVHANVYSSSDEYQLLVDFIREENPDIVVLQEMTNEWVAGIGELFQHYPYTYVETRRGNFGMAALSKIPFDSVGHVDSPPYGYPTIVGQLTVSGASLTVISSHPTIPLGPGFYAARNKQLESLVDLVNAQRGNRLLIGDFNTSLWCPQYQKLEDSTGLVNTKRGFGVSPSWPTFMPPAMIPIDHALISEGIGVVESRPGRRIGSDHLPLVVTISL